ncbi:MAG: polysaccharide deacetylase family protein [Hyphomicrobiaceae bacterium]
MWPNIDTRSKVKRVALAAAVAATMAGFVAGSPSAQQGSSAPPACANAAALGVERIVEIDTAGGPMLGNLQYNDIDFLEPGEVVLTFDDGPSRQSTDMVLAALTAHCTRATFFMVGRMAVADPDMVRKVHALGHTVGTHTWSHANQKAINATRAEQEIELGISAVTAALGQPIAPFFRFPYLNDPATSIRHLERRDQGIFSIDVDSKDFQTRNPAVMQQRVMRDLKKRGKGIILFHDIQRSTATGIANVLDDLKRGGFKVVHIVPKSPATTLPQFDNMARKELERRNAVAAASPLAPRAAVWPMSTGEDKPAATVGRGALPWKSPDATARPTKPAPSPPTDAVGTAEAALPQPPKATAGPVAAERPKPWKREELPWQDQMFQHYR